MAMEPPSQSMTSTTGDGSAQIIINPDVQNFTQNRIPGLPENYPYPYPFPIILQAPAAGAPASTSTSTNGGVAAAAASAGSSSSTSTSVSNGGGVPEADRNKFIPCRSTRCGASTSNSDSNNDRPESNNQNRNDENLEDPANTFIAGEDVEDIAEDNTNVFISGPQDTSPPARPPGPPVTTRPPSPNNNDGGGTTNGNVNPVPPSEVAFSDDQLDSLLFSDEQSGEDQVRLLQSRY